MIILKLIEFFDQIVIDFYIEIGQLDIGNVGEILGNIDFGYGLVVENGVVRDFVIGIIIYVMDIYDGEFLEVIQSEIIGGYIIDFYIGEFIFLFEIFFLIGNI